MEIKKDIISKREDRKIDILNETLEMLYRNRNEYRYIFSLLCSYVNPIEYEGYEKYLDLNDNRLTIKEIHYKVKDFLEKGRSINEGIRRKIFRDSIYSNLENHLL